MENQSITVTDLSIIKNIINVACTRGAFQAGEVKQVGEVYEKLSAFLDAVLAQAKSQEAEQSATEQSQGESK